MMVIDTESFEGTDSFNIAWHVIIELLLTVVPITVRYRFVIFPLYVGAETLTPRDAGTLETVMESTK